MKMTDIDGNANVEQTSDEKSSKQTLTIEIKKEDLVIVKKELAECTICTDRSSDLIDINSKTNAGTVLLEYISKYTQVNLSEENTSKQICKGCFELIDVLEQAETEYKKLKEAFQAILSKNPLFELQVTNNSVIKDESDAEEKNSDSSDSDYLPLASRSKKKRNLKPKKKNVSTNRRNLLKKKNDKNDESWECKECDVKSNTGGQAGLVEHMLSKHIASVPVGIKKEEEKPQASEEDFEDIFKLEDGFADNDDDDYIPDEEEKEDKIVKKRGRKKGSILKKEPKKLYYCDTCPSKYTSTVRLERHKRKHEETGKPPFICEICGASYKHKRACDVHVALHKGISDWKCEECNKLFPSKNALQRHNNIHTGKLNYQCDLCGKSFIHTSSFKMHKLSHSGVKPHSCDVCGLALMTRSHLKRHKRVHSGEKRHECSVCGKRFSERYNLLAHSKSHDPNSVPDNGLERRRMFRCPYCQERFERRYMLERHVSTAHGRSLERPPPTPRNTMSKLLKAQAQRRANPHGVDDTYNSDTKDSQSPEARTSPAVTQQKITPTDPISAWTNAYAAEFGLRQDYAQ